MARLRRRNRPVERLPVVTYSRWHPPTSFVHRWRDHRPVRSRETACDLRRPMAECRQRLTPANQYRQSSWQMRTFRVRGLPAAGTWRMATQCFPEVDPTAAQKGHQGGCHPPGRAGTAPGQPEANSPAPGCPAPPALRRLGRALLMITEALFAASISDAELRCAYPTSHSS